MPSSVMMEQEVWTVVTASDKKRVMRKRGKPRKTATTGFDQRDDDPTRRHRPAAAQSGRLHRVPDAQDRFLEGAGASVIRGRTTQ